LEILVWVLEASQDKAGSELCVGHTTYMTAVLTTYRLGINPTLYCMLHMQAPLPTVTL
jgi:hypothetical protein